ncbi:MAG: hypothetical protein QOF73_2197 [Thermomicrobiales bacterium]|nr:hypothetical protein [Thermomicrobiales bacterium]
MSFLDRLLGRRPEPRNDWQRRATPRRPTGFAGGTPSSGQLTDEQAVERYRYLLSTAPPEAIEQAHAEAFAQLTPEQRRLVLEGLSRELPPQERAGSDDPRSLARMATRAEMRRPGTLERTFGGMNPGGMGIGLGGLMAGSFLSSIAGVVIGTAIADAMFNDGGDDQGNADGSEATDGDQGADTADAGYDSGDGGYDTGGDFGGGDFGGGDFGGGEF